MLSGVKVSTQAHPLAPPRLNLFLLAVWRVGVLSKERLQEARVALYSTVTGHEKSWGKSSAVKSELLSLPLPWVVYLVDRVIKGISLLSTGQPLYPTLKRNFHWEHFSRIWINLKRVIEVDENAEDSFPHVSWCCHRIPRPLGYSCLCLNTGKQQRH